MKLITLSAYNRPNYFRRVLQHLTQCWNIKNYRLHVCIDIPGPTDKLIALCRYFQNQLRLTYEINHTHLDCNGNLYKCLDYGFQHTDFLIHIEDDIILAKDAILYFEHCDKTYKEDKTIFTVSAYNRYVNRQYQPKGITILHRKQEYDPWGWATWKDRWIEMQENWQFGYEARYKNGIMVLAAGKGWDVNLNEAVRGDRYRIFPECARCKNIGEFLGRHTPSPEFHNEHHNIKWWANNYQLDPQITFHEE